MSVSVDACAYVAVRGARDASEGVQPKQRNGSVGTYPRVTRIRLVVRLFRKRKDSRQSSFLRKNKRAGHLPWWTNGGTHLIQPTIRNEHYCCRTRIPNHPTTSAMMICYLNAYCAPPARPIHPASARAQHSRTTPTHQSTDPCGQRPPVARSQSQARLPTLRTASYNAPEQPLARNLTSGSRDVAINSLSAAANASEIASFTITSSASHAPAPAPPPPPPSEAPPAALPPPPQNDFRPRPPSPPPARPKMLWPKSLLLPGERVAAKASVDAAAAASRRLDRLAREEVTCFFLIRFFRFFEGLDQHGWSVPMALCSKLSLNQAWVDEWMDGMDGWIDQGFRC